MDELTRAIMAATKELEDHDWMFGDDGFASECTPTCLFMTVMRKHLIKVFDADKLKESRMARIAALRAEADALEAGLTV